MEIDVQHVQYHRNGVAGEPFYSVTFHYADEDGVPHEMIGVVFDFDPYEAPGNHSWCRTAVLDREHLVPENPSLLHGEGIPRFRGDRFDRALQQAIRAAAAQYDAAASRGIGAEGLVTGPPTFLPPEDELPNEEV